MKSSYYHPRLNAGIFPCSLPGPGNAPSAEDLLNSNVFADALDILKAPQTWRQDTAESINQLFNGPPIQYSVAMCAVTRFRAVVEELYKKKVLDRPYWILPERPETVSPLPCLFPGTILGI